MNIRKTLRLSASNWKLTIKAVMTQLITISAFIGIAAIFMTSSINNAINAIKSTEVLENLQNLISQLNTAGFNSETFSDSVMVFVASVQEALELMPNFYKNFVLTGILLITGAFVGKLVNGFWDLAITNSLNEFMTTSNSRPYFWWYTHSIGKSVLFQLLYIALTFFWDIFNIIGTGALFLLMPSALNGIGIAIALTIFLILTTLRLTVFAFWLPAYSSGELTLTQSLKDGLKAVIDKFAVVFMQTFVVVFIYGILLAIIILSLNSIWIFIAAIAIGLYVYYILKCMNVVEYYEAKGKAYFVKPVKLDLKELD